MDNIIITKSWGGKENLLLNKNDDIDTIKRKIKELKKFIKNPKELPKLLQSQYFTHQIMFPKKIDLSEYLLGIICHDCNEKKIKNIIKNTLYENIKIYTNGLKKNPTLKELLE
jgi:hypothetical protein